MNTYKSFYTVLLCMAALLTLPACKTNNATKGAVIGGASGGVIGGVVGKKAGNTAVGILIGSAVGGTAGALIGNYMDKQAAEIRRDTKGATVERVGEGILITFDSGLLFAVNSFNLNSQTQKNLNELSRILAKYDDTEVLIEGHTDSTGTDDINQTLSERRAKSVAAHLIRQGIKPSRLTDVGYGKGQPVESNDTVAGRQANRRVEVAIYANKKLKKAAKRGKI